MLLTGRFGEDNAEEVLTDGDDVCFGRSLKLSASQTACGGGGWTQRNTKQFNAMQYNAM